MNGVSTWDSQAKQVQVTIIPSGSNCTNNALERSEKSFILCKALAGEKPCLLERGAEEWEGL